MALPTQDPIPQCSPEARQRLLGEWSGPAWDPGLVRDEGLHQLFEATADRSPQLPAVEMGGRSLSYGELEARANRIAHLLGARGACRGSHVALFLPRSLDVYATLLGILKCGAAYVPLDPEYPRERVSQILQDSGARILVSVSGLAARLGPGTYATVLLDQEGPALEAQSSSRIPRSQTGVGPEDPCYAIFTSGSTGRPKGVSVPHRAACNLVRTEGQIFGVGPQDRVFQGFSIAFDASVEEVWLAFHAGATLVAGSAEDMRSGPELPSRLSRAGITVLSTVPTLLSTFQDDIPGLRLLILGGEACPADLAQRWARPGRRLVNTYGPTEATVIATFADLEPGRPVTIGRALPNDRLYVLDEQLRLVPPGLPGELCLSGAGLALGYLGRPDLTAERFKANPFAQGPFTERLYLTGDLVRFDAKGDLEFLGRRDEQVKIRGFRVELGEIEEALRERPEILLAAATLRQDGGPERLVAYVVLKEGCALDEDALMTWLRTRLPVYMVPALVEPIGELPTLASGKVDRKSLPAPRPRAAKARTAELEPRSPFQARMTEGWGRLFHREDLDLDEDFFLDLGGHSLLAALMVSDLRTCKDFESLSVPDVYAFPTLRRLAAELETRQGREDREEKKQAAPPAPVSRRGRILCQLGQFGGLYPILGYFGLQWLAPYLAYSWMIDHDFSRTAALMAAFGGLLCLYPAMYLLSIALKWALLGRVKPGVHRVWGLYYWRWWLVNRLLSATPTGYLVGTPMYRLYLRMMGASIGRDAHFASDCVRAFDLLRVGEDTSIGVDARLEGYSIEGGLLRIGAITLGKRCYVGARSVLGLDVCMEDGSSLGELSLLPTGARIPEGQRWVGSPAKPLPLGEEDRLRAATEAHKHSRTRKLLFTLCYALGAFLVPVSFLAAILPGMMLLNELWIKIPGYFGYLWAVPLAALSYIILLALEILAAKWLLLGRVRPGTFEIHTGFYLRKWFIDQFMEVSLDLLAPLYATLYLNPWYRALGARVGPRAEISTAGAATPDLLSIGEEAFIADAASLGTPRYDLGRVTLRPTLIGRRAFVGNSAIVPNGTELGDLALVGVLSAPPLDPLEARRRDASWLGSPAIYLPRRAHAGGFNEEETFRPTKRLVALRLFIEFFRVLLPATGFALLTCLLLTAMTELESWLGLGAAIALFPLLYFLGGVGACLFTSGMKWLLMGRYRPGEKPLWCGFVWRTELVTGLHEGLADPWILRMCMGTPLVPLFFRGMGSKIGRDACMESTCLTEYDLITLGDDVCLGSDCTLQTHLFEDRVMKMSTIVLGRGCSVGTDAVVLYDTRMEEGASLGELSLLMKGEVLPAGSHWEGSPARRLG